MAAVATAIAVAFVAVSMLFGLLVLRRMNAIIKMGRRSGAATTGLVRTDSPDTRVLRLIPVQAKDEGDGQIRVVVSERADVLRDLVLQGRVGVVTIRGRNYSISHKPPADGSGENPDATLLFSLEPQDGATPFGSTPASGSGIVGSNSYQYVYMFAF